MASGEASEVKGLMLGGGKSIGGLDVAAWRVFRPVVEADKCKRCWLCAIEMVKEE